jgi:ubiquinone/menaquinone biosynthesis C-methylase UbiE
MYAALRKHAPQGSVLDIGCGTGSFAALVAKDANYRVSAVDPAKNMIAECGKHAMEAGVKVDFRIASAGRLPFADESFDMVFSNGALHHWQDPVAGLNEIHRVLKPGGRVMINDLHKNVDRNELDRVVGSRIESPQARQAFLEFAPRGAFSREEVSGYLEKSRFEKFDVRQKTVNLEITMEK